MKCPQCHFANPPKATECDACGVVFKHLRGQIVQSSAKDAFTGQTCAFDDRGRGCQHRGILSSTTTGAGSWFCREHWDVINGCVPAIRGNEPVPSTGRSLHMRQWDDWTYNAKTRRLERIVTVAPELDALVPEEVGQR